MFFPRFSFVFCAVFAATLLSNAGVFGVPVTDAHLLVARTREVAPGAWDVTSSSLRTGWLAGGDGSLALRGTDSRGKRKAILAHLTNSKRTKDVIAAIQAYVEKHGWRDVGSAVVAPDAEQLYATYLGRFLMKSYMDDENEVKDVYTADNTMYGQVRA